MNIFEKIQAVRVELRHTKLKMSGKNKFANYEYMEPTISFPHSMNL